MPKFQPNPVPRPVAMQLLESGAIYYSPEDLHVLWFGSVLNFSYAQRDCWQVLWNNFFRGNLPIPHERVIKAWRGTTTHIFHIFKQNAAWKERIIVGDGKGNYWLRVPPEAYSLADSTPAPENGSFSPGAHQPDQ